jgi:hypothetical protein
MLLGKNFELEAQNVAVNGAIDNTLTTWSLSRTTGVQ